MYVASWVKIKGEGGAIATKGAGGATPPPPPPKNLSSNNYLTDFNVADVATATISSHNAH